MTLQQLKYAIEVADKGSISEAAKSLFVSQPSLSAAIKELEKEIQITVFARTNRGIIVSADGAEFLGYARQVLQQVELLED
jgi:DNA-binding transcriptional LysR family regulator